MRNAAATVPRVHRKACAMNDSEGADLETLDPFDLDLDGPPGPPSPGRGESGPPAARRGRGWMWAAGAVGVAVWLALWVGFGPEHTRRVADTATTTETTSFPLRTEPFVPSFGADPFGEGKGRFAVVVEGRLWLVDARSREVTGAQGVSRARIIAVSGPSVLVISEDPKTAGTRYLVDGRTGATVRAADGAWFPRAGGGWWIAYDGTLTSSDEHFASPEGFVVVAHVAAGFVIAPTDGGGLMLWDERSGSTRPLGRPPHTGYLGGDEKRIALADPRCPSVASPQCSIEIVDVASGRTTSVRVPFTDEFVRDAAFSGDGRRIAVWGTKGVALVDPTTGDVAVALKAAQLVSTPLTFTSDSTELLVLEDPTPYRQVVVLRADTGRFVRSWVSQQQLEQIVALSTDEFVR